MEPCPQGLTCVPARHLFCGIQMDDGGYPNYDINAFLSTDINQTSCSVDWLDKPAPDPLFRRAATYNESSEDLTPSAGCLAVHSRSVLRVVIISSIVELYHRKEPKYKYPAKRELCMQ